MKRSRVRSFPSWSPRLLASAFSFLLVVALVLYLNVFERGVWDGNRRFTLVVQASQKEGMPAPAVYILSLEPRQDRAIIIRIPAMTLVDVPYGYKSYPVSSIYKLGQLEGKKEGGTLLTKAIEVTFGVPVESYIIGGGDFYGELPTAQDDIQRIKNKLFSMKGIFTSPFHFSRALNQKETSLSFLDKLRLWFALRSLRIDQISFVDLEKTPILNDLKQPDGSTVKILDVDTLDVSLTNVFQDAKVRSEQVSIEVVNTTDYPRLASQFGRVLDHYGVNVVKIASSEELQRFPCLVITSQAHKQSIVVTRLQHIYGCRLELYESASSSGDITVRIGKGMLQ